MIPAAGSSKVLHQRIGSGGAEPLVLMPCLLPASVQTGYLPGATIVRGPARPFEPSCPDFSGPVSSGPDFSASSLSWPGGFPPPSCFGHAGGGGCSAFPQSFSSVAA